MRTEWIAERQNDAVRTQMHYARQGIVTEEMQLRRAAREPRAGTHPLRSGARPHDHSRQHPPRQPGADVHRRRIQVQDQLQHRQLRGHLEYRGRAGEAALLGEVRRRYGDGSFHRRRHPAHPPGHHRRIAGAHRHRADLRSALARAPRGRPERLADAGSDRGAGRAGRGLHDHPRRRAGAAHPAGCAPRHRHRQPRRIDPGRVDGEESSPEHAVRKLRRDLQDLPEVRRQLLAGRRLAARIGGRRQRRRAVRRAEDAGRADQEAPGNTTCR